MTEDSNLTPAESQPAVEPVPPSSVTVYQRRGPNTAGCILTFIVALLVGGGLIVAGLFLPPFNLAERLFGPQYIMISPTANAVASEGLTLIFDTADLGRDFGVALTSVDGGVLASQPTTNTPDWVRPAIGALSPLLTPITTVHHIATTGTPPEALTLDIALPANIAIESIDAYGFDTLTGRWRFLPSRLTTANTLAVALDDLPDAVTLFAANQPAEPTIIVPVDITQSLTREAAQIASIVTPAGLSPNAAGQLIGSLAPGFQLNSGYRVMPLVRNYENPRAIDVGTVQGLIETAAGRRAHTENLAAVAIGSGFDGIFIDYRGLPESSRAAYSTFISELKQVFASNGLRLGLILPQPVNENGVWLTDAYDWQALGAAADYVVVDFSLDPMNFIRAENGLVEATLRWGMREVSRYKLVASLNALSLREGQGVLTPVNYRDALNRLGNVVIEPPLRTIAPGEPFTARLDGLTAQAGIETAVSAPFMTYFTPEGTVSEKIWLTTPQALLFRLETVTPLAFGGIYVSDLSTGGLAEGIAETLMSHKIGLLVTVNTPDIGLRWQIQGSGGVIDELTTGLNESIVVTLDAVQGNIAVNVAVVDGELSIPRTGAQVALLYPTTTPTPLPTQQPTFIPTATQTLSPIVPTSTVRPGFNFGSDSLPAIIPGAGSIRMGTFEYGGQVTDVNNPAAISAMRQAGMTWMKIQAVYRPGRNHDEVGSLVRAAKDHGFKILISAVGHPDDLASGGGAYIQQFAAFLGGVASYGPDAIEVWNEANINREWPTGQISGANYVAVLGAASSAIRSASPNTMIITAAPAPTGGEAAFPAGYVRNDDAWLEEMVAAGGLRYADCVGVHYNEGIVPPNATSGDPRGDYYTRFFGSMVSLYSGITGGAPLCFTELGYLSPEGYGASLAESFSWGANTRVDQHAAWLAEAIALGSQSGRVRMIIVWNVDFTRYDGSDPQGGYAMIRPGGGCPACAAIAAAR